jgi:hypothetical protein
MHPLLMLRKGQQKLDLVDSVRTDTLPGRRSCCFRPHLTYCIEFGNLLWRWRLPGRLFSHLALGLFGLVPLLF